MSVPCTVGPMGVIEALGRRYWAPELAGRKGWPVELHFDQDDECYPSVYTRGRLERLCTAALIGDAGFLNGDAARERAARLRARRASIVRLQIAEALNIIDQRIERAMQGPKPLRATPGHDGKRGLMRRLRDARDAFFHDRELSGEQTAHGVDLDLEELQAVFLNGEALFDSHSDAPAVDNDSEPTAADSAAQPISQGEK